MLQRGIRRVSCSLLDDMLKKAVLVRVYRDHVYSTERAAQFFIFAFGIRIPPMRRCYGIGPRSSSVSIGIAMIVGK